MTCGREGSSVMRLKAGCGRSRAAPQQLPAGRLRGGLPCLGSRGVKDSVLHYADRGHRHTPTQQVPAGCWLRPLVVELPSGLLGSQVTLTVQNPMRGCAALYRSSAGWPRRVGGWTWACLGLCSLLAWPMWACMLATCIVPATACVVQTACSLTPARMHTWCAKPYDWFTSKRPHCSAASLSVSQA